MKRLIALLPLLFLVAAFTACDQENMNEGEKSVPENVLEAFNRDYSGAADARWEKGGDYFEVEFELNDLHQEVVYDAEAQVIQTEVAIASEALPTAAISYINAHYNGAELNEIERVNTKEAVYYDVELKLNDEVTELLFDANGTFIDSNQEDDDDDDDEEGDDD